jgi:hypothetical protein
MAISDPPQASNQDHTMPITVSCPGCGAKLNVPDTAAGKKVKCPKCSAHINTSSPAGTAKAAPRVAKPLPDPAHMPNPDASSAFTPPEPRFPAMPYVEQNLLPGEQVMYCGEVHWAVFILGIILLPLFGIGLLFLLAAYIEKRTTELAVTNQRVIIKKGLISRKTIEMNIAKVENIQVDQNIFGRILNYGTVTVVGTGGTREPFRCIADPLAFRKAVQVQSHN